MSAENGSSGGAPKVEDALVAALGFEPPSEAALGAAAEEHAGETKAAVVPGFAATTIDGVESSPPKGTSMGKGKGKRARASSASFDKPANQSAAAKVATSPTAATPNRASPIDTDPGVLDGLDSALGDLSSALDGTVVAGTGAAETGPVETVRATPPDELSDLDSSGVKPLSSPVPKGGRRAKTEKKTTGLAGGAEAAPPSPPDVPAVVAPTPPMPMFDMPAPAEVAPGLPGFEPSSPPLTEQVPGLPQGVPGEAPPLAGGLSAAGGVVAARQGSAQSIGDRLSDAASRLPKLVEDGLRQRPRRVRARKVRRVVRHVDPWSMLTFSVLFHLCLFAALLLASVLVWNAALAAGTIENIEDFIRDLGDYKTYEINGDVVFRAAMVIAGILTLASSLLVVLLTVVFNLISDLVGGIRITVIEEETVRVRRRSNQ